jgi:hypothetical protein
MQQKFRNDLIGSNDLKIKIFALPALIYHSFVLLSLPMAVPRYFCVTANRSVVGG